MLQIFNTKTGEIREFPDGTSPYYAVVVAHLRQLTEEASWMDFALGIYPLLIRPQIILNEYYCAIYCGDWMFRVRCETIPAESLLSIRHRIHAVNSPAVCPRPREKF
jgi:hypothetical protein